MLFVTFKKIWCTKNSGGGGILQIVDRDSMNLYPIYPLFPCSYFYLKCWGGGGIMFFLHFMLFPTFLEKNSGNNFNLKKKQFFFI